MLQTRFLRKRASPSRVHQPVMMNMSMWRTSLKGAGVASWLWTWILTNQPRLCQIHQVAQEVSVQGDQQNQLMYFCQRINDYYYCELFNSRLLFVLSSPLMSPFWLGQVCVFIMTYYTIITNVMQHNLCGCLKVIGISSITYNWWIHLPRRNFRRFKPNTLTNLIYIGLSPKGSSIIIIYTVYIMYETSEWHKNNAW